MEPPPQIRTGQITLTPTEPQLREIKNALGLLLDRLRADHAHARHPQQREYLTTRITTIYDLLKTLRHAPDQN